jgi:NAD(P)-dependent dehydrogenase (short-subunit alcohol dehydrogenase family)
MQSFVHVHGWPNSTSKPGMRGFRRSLAVEFGKDGIRDNAIGPGPIETKTNAEPNRPGKPEDIAGPAVFLASDRSAYVSGHIIMADGGYSTV